MKKIRGFTLPELIVGMLIFIMIITAASGILISSQGILIRQTEAVQRANIGDGICQFIRHKLKDAQNMNITEIRLSSEQDKLYSEVMYFRSGRVYLSSRNDDSEEFVFDANKDDLYGNEYYNCTLLQVRVKNPAKNLIDVTVELYEEADKGIPEAPCYRSDYNLLLSNISDPGGGELVCEKNAEYTSDGSGLKGFYTYLS